MRAESFPVFAALLNALHRGVAVRIVTNNYNNPAQPSGTVPMLDFLVLNGANISYYTSTTFMHAKYMAIDGKVVSISSVNYSETSFMQNREAGLYITGSAVVNFCGSVFDYDFSAAIPLVPGSYSHSDMQTITDPTQIKVHPTSYLELSASLMICCRRSPRSFSLKFSPSLRSLYLQAQLFLMPMSPITQRPFQFQLNGQFTRPPMVPTPFS
jgi:phosphatidylserine/phosphatidylglycerophosphate/cardiolipin synthase-like enzyme